MILFRLYRFNTPSLWCSRDFVEAGIFALVNISDRIRTLSPGVSSKNLDEMWFAVIPVSEHTKTGNVRIT
jgi:hypothetical protein